MYAAAAAAAPSDLIKRERKKREKFKRKLLTMVIVIVHFKERNAFEYTTRIVLHFKSFYRIQPVLTHTYTPVDQ